SSFVVNAYKQYSCLHIYFLLIYFFHVYVIFFFSSRRRHTRFSRDWSSDVCSSDLTVSLSCLPRWMKSGSGCVCAVMTAKRGLRRSEERRVGKEGRCGKMRK